MLSTCQIFCLQILYRPTKANRYIKQNGRKLYDQLRSNFIFKGNHVFTEEENNLSEKVVIVEEELHCIGILEDLPRLVFVEKECGNLKVFINGEDLTRSIDKKKPDVLQTYRCPLGGK